MVVDRPVAAFTFPPPAPSLFRPASLVSQPQSLLIPRLARPHPSHCPIQPRLTRSHSSHCPIQPHLARPHPSHCSIQPRPARVKAETMTAGCWVSSVRQVCLDLLHTCHAPRNPLPRLPELPATPPRAPV
ncbi:hypothetical protein E2C01_054003 [Portunus trituberculatus]|uniref:Uncharacterized protein n=1 Tax=Portunus trituberculatus TaxID=210409 RepID=A0A5B7GI56_PORTR|nr:hypothetical protein [Portunus trituberculatus]